MPCLIERARRVEDEDATFSIEYLVLLMILATSLRVEAFSNCYIGVDTIVIGEIELTCFSNRVNFLSNNQVDIDCCSINLSCDVSN